MTTPAETTSCSHGGTSGPTATLDTTGLSDEEISLIETVARKQFGDLGWVRDKDRQLALSTIRSQECNSTAEKSFLDGAKNRLLKNARASVRPVTRDGSASANDTAPVSTHPSPDLEVRTETEALVQIPRHFFTPAQLAHGGRGFRDIAKEACKRASVSSISRTIKGYPKMLRPKENAGFFCDVLLADHTKSLYEDTEESKQARDNRLTRYTRTIPEGRNLDDLAGEQARTRSQLSWGPASKVMEQYSGAKVLYEESLDTGPITSTSIEAASNAMDVIQSRAVPDAKPKVLLSSEYDDDHWASNLPRIEALYAESAKNRPQGTALTAEYLYNTDISPAFMQGDLRPLPYDQALATTSRVTFQVVDTDVDAVEAPNIDESVFPHGRDDDTLGIYPLPVDSPL